MTISIPRRAAEYAVRLLRDAADRDLPVILDQVGGAELDRMALESCTRMSLLGFLEDQHHKLANGIDPDDRPAFATTVRPA